MYQLKVLSAKAKERDVLGERAGTLGPNDALAVVQSSDDEFHCLTLVVFRGFRG